MNKNIFALRENESSDAKDAKSIEQDKETYEQYGFRIAGEAGGGQQAFIPCLQAVCLGLKKKQEEDIDLQNKLKQDLENRKTNKESEKEQAENYHHALTNKQQNLEEQLDSKKQELSEIRNAAYQRNRDAWIILIISSIILVPFTLYFFIFYSSVAYSAFFKKFKLENLGQDGDLDLAAAIFDSQALPNAMADGFTALLFILLMPIIFMAFGFILNRWEEEKGWLKWAKIPLLLVVTFIFDALLSFEICEKIYNLHKDISWGEELPDYSVSLAAHDPRFWIIICLGFVSYIIWGITFSYFIKSLNRLNLNKIIQQQISEKMELLEKDIEATKVTLLETANKIARLKADIQNLENQLNGVVVRYDVTLIKLEMSNFHTGWQRYMAGVGKHKTEKDAITSEFNKIVDTLMTI